MDNNRMNVKEINPNTTPNINCVLSATSDNEPKQKPTAINPKIDRNNGITLISLFMSN